MRMGTSLQQQGRCLGWQLQLAESHDSQGLAAVRLLLACHTDQLLAHLLLCVAQGHLMHAEAASALATGDQQLLCTCAGVKALSVN